MNKWFLILALSTCWPLAAQTKLPKASGPEPGQVQPGAAPRENPGIRQVGPSAASGSSQAVVVDEVPLAHTGQFFPLNKKGRLVGPGNAGRQVNQVFDNIAAALKAAGSGLDMVVKVNVYLAKPELMTQVQEQFGKRFRATTKPAVSFVVGHLAHAGALVAMDAVAAAPAAGGASQVQYFRSPALAATSPAAQVAVLPKGGVVYVAGQADKGALVEATRGTLSQLAATLQHLGLQKHHVVQIKAFTSSMTDIGLVNQELALFFGGAAVPPVVYVEWLSQNPVIEIELIAASPAAGSQAGGQLEFITPPFMTASPVYSRVARINRGRKVYVSGLYGPASADAQTQVKEIFSSLDDILKQAGSGFNHLAKATYYVSNDQTSDGLNEIRPRYYDPKRPPAASKAMVKGVGPAAKGITLDMIGVVVQQE